MKSTQDLLALANAHKKSINLATSQAKNQALKAMAQALLDQSETILDANAKDQARAQGQISDALMDRLSLNQQRLEAMAQGILALVDLEDPVGQIIEVSKGAQDLDIIKKRVAFGVIGIIYESRPNVTSDAAALALKSGNALVLRTGKEAFLSAQAIVNALKTGLAQTSISPDVIQLIEDTSRQSAYELMKAKGSLDLLIPRGGAGLIQAVVENALVPVIETGTGIVHIYVDKDADLDMATKIVHNAKTSRPSVCNALEVCLVHQTVATDFLPALRQKLLEDPSHPVELRLDAQAAQIIPGKAAQAQDFDTEFSDYILSIAVVESLEAAVDHIEKHSTHHSEAIITDNVEAADYFTDRVDSAAVYVNASTRFTDGGEFGLGCEMGISTQKLHARGPMGLKEMTTYKYIIQGKGQVR